MPIRISCLGFVTVGRGAGQDEVVEPQSILQGRAFGQPIDQGEQLEADAVEFFAGLDGEDHLGVVEGRGFGEGIGEQEALVEESA